MTRVIVPAVFFLLTLCGIQDAPAQDGAGEVNLMEDPGRELVVANSTLKLDRRPFEIKTIKFRLRPQKAASR